MDKLLHEDAADSLAGQLAALRAERDRFKADRDFLLGQNARMAKAQEALAAENAGLRGAAERYLRATGRPASEEYLNQPAYLEAVAAHDAFLAALTSPSPVTQAVQRVLAAVGRMAQLDRDFNRAVREGRGDDAHKLGLQVSPALDTAIAAHDALRALLEGREAES